MTKPLLLVPLLLSFIAVGTALAEEPNKDEIVRAEQSYYTRIRTDVKQQFDREIAEAQKIARTRNPSISEQDLDQLVEDIKYVFYNKVNVSVICIGEILSTPSQEKQRLML